MDAYERGGHLDGFTEMPEVVGVGVNAKLRGVMRKEIGKGSQVHSHRYPGEIATVLKHTSYGVLVSRAGKSTRQSISYSDLTHYKK